MNPEGEPMHNRLRLTGTLLGICLLLAGSCGCSQSIVAESPGQPSGSRSSLDRVTAGHPKRTTLKRFTVQPGRIEAFEETPLYPKLNGYVGEVLVDIGDVVKQDQTLIRLAVPELQDELEQKQALVAQAEAEVKQSEASVEAAEAARESARARVLQAEAGIGRADGEHRRWSAEHARIRELAANGSVTKKLEDETLNQLRAAEAAKNEVAALVQSAQAQLVESEVNIRQAHADTAAAEARLRVARANLAHTRTLHLYAELKAPFPGVVTRRSVDTGHYVHPAGSGSARPLLVVARVDRVRVSVDVPEMDAPLVNTGDAATIRVQSLAGKELNGAVARDSWSLDASNRSLRTEVDIPNPDGTLRPGMYANVTILLEQRPDVLSLPASAIVREGPDAYCCLVASGKIDRRRVELGLRSGDEIEIVSGVRGDELVVLARAESLRHGQPVDVSTPPQ
jgi:RND family efflux transporter MFP subunit